MQKFILDNRINILFIIISFSCLVLFVGIENISFEKTEWLHDGGDSTLPQLGWYFFKNDIWRFPIGSNPNYGLELGSSIVFADSIPILTLIFKTFRSLLPENFQYISLWYFLCFYLQLFFSFKILSKFTNSTLFSLIGSLFFLVTPIFTWSIHFVPALVGQWILILTLYLGLTTNVNKSKTSWFLLIILSSLINFYFMVTILFIYSLLRIFNLEFKKENIFILIKDFFIISPLLLLTMYLVGYFEVRMADTMSIGFGAHKLNLLGIIDPVNSIDKFNWSWFLPDIKTSYGEETHGFNYFGLGQILLLIFALVLLLKKKYETNLISIKKNKSIKYLIIISLLLTLWSLSTKISFGPYTLLEIPLNKYIYGVLSIVRPTGRLFWIVNYFLLAISIIIIFKCLDKKKSLFIITSLLIIQTLDTSAGTKNRTHFLKSTNENGVKDKLWKDLFDKYKVLKDTYPKNYPSAFSKFSYLIENKKIEKTNIVKLARINRESVAKAKYKLYKIFRDKNLSSNTIYIINDLGHLRHLKHIFTDQDVGFFYRDNIWAMVLNEKERMNDSDIKAFDEIKPKLLTINQKRNLFFEDKDNFYGLGWSHNFKKPGIWSEGYVSTLLFKTNETVDLKLEIICAPYITKKNSFLEINIYVNNTLNKNMKLNNNKEDEKFEILINKDSIKNNEIKIDFEFKNPTSPYEVLESPDSRKLGILLKSIMIKPI